MIRTLFWSSIFALTVNGSVFAQMGGGMGAEMPMPEVDGETWIWLTPEKWYPYSKTSDVKNDVFIFPTGQKPDKWKQMLQFEQFASTLNITDVKQVYDLKTQNLKNCTFESLKTLSEKGYSMTQWSERCPLDGETAVTIRKATLGTDRLYLVSKIWKSEPSDSEMEKWTRYLDQTYVCDGTEQHDCRPPRAQGGPGGPR